MQRDLLGLSAGPNLYQYAGSKPTIFTDPLGLLADPATTAVVLEAVEVATGGTVITSVGAAISACALFPPCAIMIITIGIVAIASIVAQLIQDGTIATTVSTTTTSKKEQCKKKCSCPSKIMLEFEDGDGIEMACTRLEQTLYPPCLAWYRCEYYNEWDRDAPPYVVQRESHPEFCMEVPA